MEKQIVITGKLVDKETQEPEEGALSITTLVKGQANRFEH
jgi:hypothetical protein